MRYLLICLVLTGCVGIPLDEEGSTVRVVHMVNADFEAECIFVRALSVDNVIGWDHGTAGASARNEIRNMAADIGANAIVYTDDRNGGFTVHRAADAYYCAPERRTK